MTIEITVTVKDERMARYLIIELGMPNSQHKGSYGICMRWEFTSPMEAALAADKIGVCSKATW